MLWHPLTLFGMRWTVAGQRLAGFSVELRLKASMGHPSTAPGQAIWRYHRSL